VDQLKRFAYFWRLAVTGLAFLTIGAGALFLALLVIPPVSLLPGDRFTRARRAQGIIGWGFRVYIRMLRLLGMVTLEVIGRERLAACRGTIVIANHPTLIDVVMIMALVPNAHCVVKHELARHWVFGPAVRAAGHIRNDQETEDFIAACREALASGNNLVIFPEGTRSVPGRPVRFQRGFAHLVTLTGAGLQPITLSCNPITLTKGQAWYAIPNRKPIYRIEAGPTLDAAPFQELGVERSLSARRLVSHIEAYYGGKLNHG